MKKFRPRQERTKLNTEIILPIIADGLRADHNILEAKFIPILIVDASCHQSIEDTVNFHYSSDSGDVISTWGLAKNENFICLYLEFLRPIKTEAIIKFILPQQAALVDTIMSSKMFYLQPGKEGDTVGKTLGNKGISIEVPCDNLRDIFTQRWLRLLFKDLRSKGCSRSEAKRFANEIIDEWKVTICTSPKERILKSKN